MSRYGRRWVRLLPRVGGVRPLVMVEWGRIRSCLIGVSVGTDDDGELEVSIGAAVVTVTVFFCEVES